MNEDARDAQPEIQLRLDLDEAPVPIAGLPSWDGLPAAQRAAVIAALARLLAKAGLVDESHSA
jgi:hypothetical protein